MKILLLTTFLSTQAFAAYKKIGSIIFNSPIPLPESALAAIVTETNYKKFYEETFEVRVKCNRYKNPNAKKKTSSPINCEMVSASKDDFSETASKPIR